MTDVGAPVAVLQPAVGLPQPFVRTDVENVAAAGITVTAPVVPLSTAVLPLAVATVAV